VICLVSDPIARQATASDFAREILAVRGQLLGQVLTVWMYVIKISYLPCYKWKTLPALPLVHITHPLTVLLYKYTTATRPTSLPKLSALKMEQIDCSETSANINQTSGKHPKDSTLNGKHVCEMKRLVG
jgi:hypothetical protein